MVRQLWQARPGISDQPEVPSQFQAPALISRFLASRGLVESSLLEGFLRPSLKSLRSPQTLAGMEKAVERLFSAYQKGETVALYADFDLDGTSGLALLHRGLESLGFKSIIPYQPMRLIEGYGFHAEAAEHLAEKGASLIVTIDVGITAIEAVERAKAKGLDVIITDHHLPKETLPLASAVINPNISECEAGLGHLCGAGVAFYLLWGLRGRFAKEGILPKDFDLKSVLDCFAIGTLTDMVPLRDENRVLVKHGLKVLENTQRPGLRILLEKLGLENRPLSSQDVAIRFAPKLNALSRLEQGLRPIDIFLEESEDQARELVGEVIKSNDQRLKLQKEAESEALESLKDWDQKGFVFVASPNFHQGVVGLVATKLAQHFNVPAFVGAQNQSGQVTGSARIPKDSPLCLVTALGAATEFLVRHGGHSAAAGFEYDKDKKDQLIESLANHFETAHESSHEKAEPLMYDVDAQLADFDDSTLNWLDHLGPFGVEFEVPLFRVARARVERIQTLRGGHLRIKLFEEATTTFKEAIWFFPRKPEELEKEGFKEGSDIELLCEVQWNYFAGRKTVQILVRDLRCL